MAISSADHAKMLPSLCGYVTVVAHAFLKEPAYGFVAQIVRGTTNRLSPTHAVPRRLLEFERELHSRFGRGRGKGTACRSTTAICAGCVPNGVEDAKKRRSNSRMQTWGIYHL